MASRILPLFCNKLLGKNQNSRQIIFQRFQSDATQLVPVEDHDTPTETKLDPFSPVKQSHKLYLENLNPPLKRAFNLAAYVNQSKTLQELVKLGVSLYDIENTNKNMAADLVKLDFDRDCADHIKFLVDNGLKPQNLGRFISEYPTIFKEYIDDLQARINYLESKKFSKRLIERALNRSSRIIAYKTKTIDYKLGELQIEFSLPATILREMVALYPPIISLPVEQYKLINFTLTDEFGFNIDEIHSILKSQPKVLEITRPDLIDRLDLLHNTMELKHRVITRFPKIITGPIIDIRHRFEYLKALKRNQFNPQEPLFVPPTAFYKISDEDFCSKYAKTNLEDYKLFLKTR